jgi:hypothetical protein
MWEATSPLLTLAALSIFSCEYRSHCHQVTVYVPSTPFSTLPGPGLRGLGDVMFLWPRDRGVWRCVCVSMYMFLRVCLSLCVSLNM